MKTVSTVAVQRGKVAVEDMHSDEKVVISKGQTAPTEKPGNMSVTGTAENSSSSEVAGLGARASDLESYDANSNGSSAGNGKSSADGNGKSNAGGNGR